MKSTSPSPAGLRPVELELECDEPRQRTVATKAFLTELVKSRVVHVLQLFANGLNALWNFVSSVRLDADMGRFHPIHCKQFIERRLCHMTVT